jgi:hypothetical protein
MLINAMHAIKPDTQRREYNRILHNTTQHNTTQHNTTQHNTTQHNTKIIIPALAVANLPPRSLISESLFLISLITSYNNKKKIIRKFNQRNLEEFTICNILNRQ